MSASITEDETVRDRESRQFELDFKGETADCRKRVRGFEKCLYKEHLLLWGRCQMTLRERIESQTGFEGTYF